MMSEGTGALSRGEIHAKDLLNEFTYTDPSIDQEFNEFQACWIG
jgi:hypothetical protein